MPATAGIPLFLPPIAMRAIGVSMTKIGNDLERLQTGD
jgi:hypothetical protein